MQYICINSITVHQRKKLTIWSSQQTLKKCSTKFVIPSVKPDLLALTKSRYNYFSLRNDVKNSKNFNAILV